MRKDIKAYLEILPILLVFESFVCFLLSFFNFYENIFAHWEQLTECSFLMCFVFYAISEKWGFVAKKSIATLFILNSINFFYSFLDTLQYYNYFIIALFSCFIYLLIYDLCLKK